MDPALQELIREDLDPNEEIEALIRLARADQYPPGIRVVTQFGEIITCRARRGDVQAIYKHSSVLSFKAPRILYHDSVDDFENAGDDEVGEGPFDDESADNLVTPQLTGKGVVIGFIDWGCDFAHVDFVNADGTSRIIAIWEQGQHRNDLSPEPFRYGKVYDRQRINAALQSPTPYQTLGYHPGKSDPRGRGMHGTHVMGIAASNGRSGHQGIAPEAEIIFVHMAGSDSSDRWTLGDSVRILEAIDFIKRTAGDKPLVINLSMGAIGGPHDGSTLVELGIDAFLEQHTNTVVCQSTGNYFSSRAHAYGLIRPGDVSEISFALKAGNLRENEIEIWYSGKDEFGITLQHDQSQGIYSCPIDSTAEITVNSNVVGRIYHRSDDPNNNRNHVDIFLYPTAPAGIWHLKIEGKKITDGRFHSWIERNDKAQAGFLDANIITSSTTNTICNSFNAIITGAYDQTSSDFIIPAFSSSGPTFDGRIKPHILAPGVKIPSSKSSPPTQQAGSDKLVQMSGTSMASPLTAGAVALILQGINRNATIHDVKKILFRSTSKIHRSPQDELRAGYGILDLTKLNDSIHWFNAQQEVSGPSREKILIEQTESAPSSAAYEQELNECSAESESDFDELIEVGMC